MNGLVGGPLLVGGLSPLDPLKSGPATRLLSAPAVVADTTRATDTTSQCHQPAHDDAMTALAATLATCLGPLCPNTTSSIKPGSIQRIATPPEEDRVAEIANMQRKLGEVWSSGTGDMLVHRRTPGP